MTESSSPIISIATVYGDHEKSVEAIANFAGITPARSKVYGLAGPNDLIQILANVDGWKAIGENIFLIYGLVEAGKTTWKTGKTAWKALAPRLESAPSALKAKWLQLVEALSAERDARQSVSIGLIEPTFDWAGRQDRVYLSRNDTLESGDLSPAEVARHFYLFACCAEPLSAWLINEAASQQRPNQISVSMKVLAEGHLVVTLTDQGAISLEAATRTKTFDATGSIIEELNS